MQRYVKYCRIKKLLAGIFMLYAEKHKKCLAKIRFKIDKCID